MRRLSYERRDLGYSFALATTIMVAASLALNLIFGGDTTGWKFWVVQALYTVFIGGSAFVYAAISKTDMITATKFDQRPPVAHVLWGCAAVAFLICCMTPINGLFIDLIENIGLHRPSVELEDSLVGMLICACILPAFTEEIVFRGTIAQSLRRHDSKVGALAIGGALFAVFHANPAQTLHQFMLGALLTLLALRSGSLWTSVIAHLFNNLVVVVLSYTPWGADDFWSFEYNRQFVTIAMIVGIVGFILCVVGYTLTTKSRWQRSDDDDDEWDDEMDDDGQISADVPRSSNMALLVGVFVCVVLWISQLFDGVV